MDEPAPKQKLTQLAPRSRSGHGRASHSRGSRHGCPHNKIYRPSLRRLKPTAGNIRRLQKSRRGRSGRRDHVVDEVTETLLHLGIQRGVGERPILQDDPHPVLCQRSGCLCSGRRGPGGGRSWRRRRGWRRRIGEGRSRRAGADPRRRNRRALPAAEQASQQAVEHDQRALESIAWVPRPKPREVTPELRPASCPGGSGPP